MISRDIVFMFTGQGSQYYQMARELYLKIPGFRKHMLEIDGIVNEIIGEHIVDIIYDEKRKATDIFDKVLYTHPAIFMVEYALAKTLIDCGIKPLYVLGTSLGEFTSIAVSEAMELRNLVECLMYQAQCFEKYTHRGGMLAIFEDANLFYNNQIIFNNSELVSVNFDKHIVVSGKNSGLNTIAEYLRNMGITYQFLPVSYPFHSSLIDSAAPHYKRFIKSKSYQIPKIKFVSGINASIQERIPDDYLWDIARQPIRFREAVSYLESMGCYVYIDAGMGGTLANFLKRNIKPSSRSECFAIVTPFSSDLGNLESLKINLKKMQSTEKTSGKEERMNKTMLAYVFPGQGSQHKGMGEGLFGEFKELTAAADAILGYSIEDLCLNDPENKLGLTSYTQPALYVVNALTYLKKLKDSGRVPDFVAGHSLGEYNALFAAGVFDFETGLKLVIKRGELMSMATGGGMAAVVGLSEEKVKAVLEDNNLHSIDIANYNTPSQIVISGPRDDIERAKPIFDAAEARTYVVLNVSGAFHSRYMTESGRRFAEFVEGFEFFPAKIPVISNVSARPYGPGDIKKNLIEQINNPVRWTESIRYLMGKGEIDIVQVGPGSVLTGLVKAIRREAAPLIITEAEDSGMQQEPGLAREIVRPSRTATVKEPTQEKNETERGFTGVSALSLGDGEFKKDYGLKYAYLTGGMYRGVASAEMVVRMGRAGMMGFFGTGGLSMAEIEDAIRYIQNELKDGQAYGMNLVHNPSDPGKEEGSVNLFLKYKIRNVEAAAYMSITPPLVKYRLKGLKKDSQGKVTALNRIIGKVSRPEVAEDFLSPAPERIVEKLLAEGEVTAEEARMAKEVPMADDLCVEADSGGHTDQGAAYVLMPVMSKLRDDFMNRYKYSKRIRVGAAGGIGTPEAAAAAFVLGADFILTGSINQCTVEAGTSDAVKDLLQEANVQDTEYAPAGDMFEMGAKVQVLKKGLFFPARANKLYDLYRFYGSIDEIDENTKRQIQERYFGKSFDEVYNEAKSYYPPQEIDKAERNPKYKMALIFKWYFGYSTNLAIKGDKRHKVNYQVHCGPALGAFNQWVKGTPLENWRNRHVDEIAVMLMNETAKLLNSRFHSLMKTG